MADLKLKCSRACTQGDPAIHHLQAPSGTQYDIVLPALMDWIDYGMIPDPLLPIAAKVEWEEFKFPEATPEERKEYRELMALCVSRMVRPKIPIEFVRGFSDDGTEVSPAMPKEDRETLWLSALRKRTPEMAIDEEADRTARMLSRMGDLEKFRAGTERLELLGNGSALPQPNRATRRGR